MVKYIIEAVSPFSGLHGYVGELDGLYPEIKDARLFANEAFAMSHVETLEGIWTAMQVKPINISFA